MPVKHTDWAAPIVLVMKTCRQEIGSHLWRFETNGE